MHIIKELVDRSDENSTVWLTGSQPLHLMQSVSESLAGRVGVIEMLGLSNAELAGAPSEPYDPSPDYFTRRAELSRPFGVDEAFERICAGSLPGIRALPEDLRSGGYESYLDTYVMRDIRDLAQVGDELRFRRFMRACAALTSRPVVYAELARIADVNEKTAKAWLSLLEGSYIVKVVEPYSNNLIKRLSKRPIMHFLDTGLAAYLLGWTSPQALGSGAMSGQMFETYAFDEVFKSFSNAGRRAPLYFFRTNDKKEIDLVMERDNTLFPIEVKRTAMPSRKDTRNLNALDPVTRADVPPELVALKRDVGMGCVLCMTQETYPINERAWAFPIWAV